MHYIAIVIGDFSVFFSSWDISHGSMWHLLCFLTFGRSDSNYTWGPNLLFLPFQIWFFSILSMFSFSDPIFPESGEAALCEIVAGGSNQSECQDCSNTDFKHTNKYKPSNKWKIKPTYKTTSTKKYMKYTKKKMWDCGGGRVINANAMIAKSLISHPSLYKKLVGKV